MEHLFKNKSKDEIRAYVNVIHNIRKKKKTKKQKIKAINRQLNFMNLMHNAGVQMSGGNKYLHLNYNTGFLNRFTKPDVDSIFSDLNIGKSRNLSQTLGNFEQSYSKMKYLDLVSDEPYDASSVPQSSNRTGQALFKPRQQFRFNRFGQQQQRFRRNNNTNNREKQYRGIPPIELGFDVAEQQEAARRRDAERAKQNGNANGNGTDVVDLTNDVDEITKKQMQDIVDGKLIYDEDTKTWVRLDGDGDNSNVNNGNVSDGNASVGNNSNASGSGGGGFGSNFPALNFDASAIGSSGSGGGFGLGFDGNDSNVDDSNVEDYDVNDNSNVNVSNDNSNANNNNSNSRSSSQFDAIGKQNRGGSFASEYSNYTPGMHDKNKNKKGKAGKVKKSRKQISEKDRQAILSKSKPHASNKKALKEYVRDMRAIGAIITDKGFTADELDKDDKANYDRMKPRQQRQFLNLIQDKQQYKNRPQQSTDNMMMN